MVWLASQQGALQEKGRRCQHRSAGTAACPRSWPQRSSTSRRCSCWRGARASACTRRHTRGATRPCRSGCGACRGAVRSGQGVHYSWTTCCRSCPSQAPTPSPRCPTRYSRSPARCVTRPPGCTLAAWRCWPTTCLTWACCTRAHQRAATCWMTSVRPSTCPRPCWPAGRPPSCWTAPARLQPTHRGSPPQHPLQGRQAGAHRARHQGVRRMRRWRARATCWWQTHTAPCPSST
mmetsp:Transcript_23264/g.59436  ORF Transcript_23264/g.59436 Transcript_23264/m.59436 type:complete len:234 (+) Transcript_23264:538-1239(+)